MDDSSKNNSIINNSHVDYLEAPTEMKQDILSGGGEKQRTVANTPTEGGRVATDLETRLRNDEPREVLKYLSKSEPFDHLGKDIEAPVKSGTIRTGTEIAQTNEENISRVRSKAIEDALTKGKDLAEAEIIAEQAVDEYKQHERKRTAMAVWETLGAEDFKREAADVPYPVFDVKELKTEQILDILTSLGHEAPILFFGANVAEPFPLLKPVSFIVGKPPSSYASSESRVAMAFAVINKNRETVIKDGMVRMAANMNVSEQGSKIFESPPEMYKRLQSDMNNLVSEGYVYVIPSIDYALSKSGHASGYSDHEFNTQNEVEPILALRVSGDIGKDLLVVGQGEDIDTVRELSDEEMAQVRGETPVESIAKILPEKAAYTGKDLVTILQKDPSYEEKMRDSETVEKISQILAIVDPLKREDFLNLVAKIIG